MYEKITYYSRMSQTLHVPVPAAVGGWTPLSLGSALKAWYKADTGVTKVGNDISGVADQSVNGFNLISANAATPQWDATGFNGFPAFDCGNGNWTLATDTGNPNGVFTGFDAAKPASVFVAATLNSGATSNGRLITYGYSTDDDFNTATSCMLISRDGTNQAIASWRSGSEQVTQAISAYDTPLRLGMIYDGTNVTPYVNKVAGTSALNGDTFASPGTLIIGNGYSAGVMSGVVEYWKGKLAEVIVTNTDVTSDLTNIDNYLKGRFGL